MSTSDGPARNKINAPTANPKLLWIHCNRCFESYNAKQQRFFVLACHHVSCEKCSPQQPSETPNGSPLYICPICSKTARGRQLGNNMPEHIKELFHPEPWSDDLPTSRIMHFQQKQRNHFFEGMLKMRRSYTQLGERIEVVRESAKQKFEELERMRRERRLLERRVQQIKLNRQRMEMERRERERHVPANSTTDESGFGSGPIIVLAGAGRGARIPHSYAQSAFARQRPSSPEDSLDVSSFVHKRTTSFNL